MSAPTRKPAAQGSRAARRERSARDAGPASLSRAVLDSSCWMEFFADTDRTDLFAGPIEQAEQLIVPVLTLYEVVKKLHREAGD